MQPREVDLIMNPTYWLTDSGIQISQFVYRGGILHPIEPLPVINGAQTNLLLLPPCPCRCAVHLIRLKNINIIDNRNCMNGGGAFPTYQFLRMVLKVKTSQMYVYIYIYIYIYILSEFWLHCARPSTGTMLNVDLFIWLPCFGSYQWCHLIVMERMTSLKMVDD